LGLPFSRPAKLIISAVGVVFWQAQQIATNALLSLAEKALGICLYPLHPTTLRGL